jgi:ribosomal protein L3
MAGHMGTENGTLYHMKIDGADEDFLLIHLGTPGYDGGWVLVKDLVKRIQWQ